MRVCVRARVRGDIMTGDKIVFSVSEGVGEGGGCVCVCMRARARFQYVRIY